MVAYSFKPRFAKPILKGLGELSLDSAGLAVPHVFPKRQTIRATGKRRHARPGETLQLYTGMRTRQCRKIGEARCIDVNSIRIIIREERLTVELDGRWVSGRKLGDFARSDGFANADDMLAFWKAEHGLGEFPRDADPMGAAVTQLRQQKTAHMRLQGGAMYGYDIFDPTRRDKVVGTKTVHINKKTRPWTETTTYALLDGTEFKTAADFLAAYEAKLKEEQP